MACKHLVDHAIEVGKKHGAHHFSVNSGTPNLCQPTLLQDCNRILFAIITAHRWSATLHDTLRRLALQPPQFSNSVFSDKFADPYPCLHRLTQRIASFVIKSVPKFVVVSAQIELELEAGSRFICQCVQGGRGVSRSVAPQTNLDHPEFARIALQQT